MLTPRGIAAENLSSATIRENAVTSRFQGDVAKCRLAKSQTRGLIAVEVRIVAEEEQAFQSFGFEQDLAALLAEETGAPPGAVEPFIAAVALVSVFRVNFEGRDSDTEPPGQRAQRALDLLEHGLGSYAVSPAS